MSMTLVSTVTVGSAIDTISFASIPATFTDLLITISARTEGAAAEVAMSINGTGGTLVTVRSLEGSGSAASSFNRSGTSPSRFIGRTPGPSETSNTFSNISVYIPNYAGSANKSYSADSVYENNATSAKQNITAGLWASTSAITSLDFIGEGWNFVAGSTISLYGILKGSGGATVS